MRYEDDNFYIDKILKGDDASFASLIEKHKTMAYNIAYRILKSREDAEEIAQDSFLKAYHSLKEFKRESKFSTWLYRITIAKALDHERRKKRKKRFAIVKKIFGDPADEGLLPDFQHPGVTFDKKETAAILFKAIKELPENQRIAFTLHKVEGLSYQEVSDVMKTSVSSVESLMHRAKNNLKKLLENYYKQQQ